MQAGIIRALFALLGIFPITGGQGLAPTPFATQTFGVSLNTGLNNQLFTLFVVKEFEGKVIGSTPITREQFILQAQGLVPSAANPEGVNLFRKYGVDGCLPEGPDTAARFVSDCGVFDNLWKIRFWDYPFRLVEGQHPGKGWAEKPDAPSARQLLLLTDYGMMRVSDVARGESAFRLLHDVGDSAWVDNYRKGY